MAVCALPICFFQMRSAAHSSNPLSSSTVIAAAATRSYVLNSRIESRARYYSDLPCIISTAAGRSDIGPVSASRSNNTTSTENKAGKEEEEEEKMEVSSKNFNAGELLVRNASACQGCGKLEKVGGCNGEGRIKGGLGAVPGFGWFPIKAYRPCPAFVEAGGKYRRQGQSLEEVAFGRAGKQDNLDISERLRGD